MKSTNDDDDLSDHGEEDSSMEECQMHEPQSFVHYRCHAEVVKDGRGGQFFLACLLKESCTFVIDLGHVHSSLNS